MNINDKIRNIDPETIKLKRVYVKDTHPTSDFRNVPGRVIDMRYVKLKPNEKEVLCLIVKYEAIRPIPLNDKNIEFVKEDFRLKSL